jgi:hypothetical protein
MRLRERDTLTDCIQRARTPIVVILNSQAIAVPVGCKRGLAKRSRDSEGDDKSNDQDANDLL